METEHATPLARALADGGVTQRDLARALGRPDAQINRWVQGHQTPIPAHRKEIARKLRVLGIETTEDSLWPNGK